MGKRPSTVPESEWHTPQASTRMRTWRGPGSSSGFLTSENCPGCETSIALYVACISPPTAFDADAARGRALLQMIIDVDVQELPPCWGSRSAQRGWAGHAAMAYASFEHCPWGFARHIPRRSHP